MDTTTAITTAFTWGETYYDEKGDYAMPEKLEEEAFTKQFRNIKQYLHSNIDTITVIQRRVMVGYSSIYGTEKGYSRIGVQYTTDLRWVVLDTTDDKILCGDHGVGQHDTQKEAETSMRKWKKSIIAHQAEAAALAELKDITMPTAFMSPLVVKALPTPNPFTKVGDLVQVRGFGKQRAGYVVEASPVRVKCIIRTVESTKRQASGDHGYCKWFKRGA
tara:strand:- start:410 stop:1063 length:654 start_codon:yes stop_codon:yes gene_type:complete